MIKRIFIALSLFLFIIPLSFAKDNTSYTSDSCPCGDCEFGCPGDLDKAIEKQSSSSSNSSTSGGCTYNIDGDVNLGSFLTACKPKKVAGGSGEFSVDGGFKTTINNWIKNISLLLGIVAVGALVYAGMLFQFSAGEDDQIKKAKGIFKWTIIGFLLLISASGMIYVVINLVYGLAS